MKFFNFLFLCTCILLASCKSGSKITKTQAAGLDTITNINLLESKKRAIYKNEKGELFIMRYEPDPRDSMQKKDTLRPGNGSGTQSTAFTIITANARCDSENFDGSERAEPKITVSTANLESFSTLRAFISTLQDADAMADSITGDDDSVRIPEEDRNVRIRKTYLYCYSRQTDEDFHVIIGTTKTPSATTIYFNVEISGLPPTAYASFPFLQSARASFLTKASERLCSSGYYFFENPLKIEIEGSLFFDDQHHNGLIGPAAARPPDAWEIHPVTSLIFK